MNKKSFAIIFLAIILALICALLFFRTEKTSVLEIEDENNVVEQIFLEDKKEVVEEQVDITEKSEQAKIDSAQITQKVLKTAGTKQKEAIEENISAIDMVHEASVVEEVPDYGLIKDEKGNIIITREFGKRPVIKYSFRDFGAIDKVVTK